MSARKNLVDRTSEGWRPPLFTATCGQGNGLGANLRRFFDFQAGSIWRDLALILPAIHGSLLDVGCGAQPYRILVTAADYRAIDSDLARQFGYEMPDTTYYSGDVWPIADRSVDCVLATETLEHISEPAHFLEQARRCLVPGGTLLLTVPFSARWHFIPHDYWRFTPSGLRILLSNAGFKNIEVFARGNEVTVACYKAVALIIRLLAPQTISGLRRWAFRLIGLLFAPALIVLAVIANVSLLAEGGDDCLGYTVIAS
jgi:SAM-dependent methyltransferase